MVHCLLNVLAAEDAIEVVSIIVVSPLQHVARVEPVMKQEPTKHFDFHSALGLPKLIACRMHLPISKVVVVVVPWFVKRGSPRIVPNIMEQSRGEIPC